MCGTSPVRSAKCSAARQPISASCSGLGSGTTAQSAKHSTRSLSAPTGGHTMMKNDDTSLTPGASPISHSAARSTSAVGRVAPATKVSASPSRTRLAAWNTGSRA